MILMHEIEEAWLIGGRLLFLIYWVDKEISGMEYDIRWHAWLEDTSCVFDA